MATTYIQFTGRLKATSQEGLLVEAQQVAVDSTANSMNIKTYIDNKIKEVQGNIGSVAGSVYRPKGSLTVANFKALTSAAVGDVYNITDQFTLSELTYPAYTNVACVKAFSAAVTPDDSYWDALGGTVDLSPYAKTDDVNTKVDTINKSISDNVSSLTTKISTAQSTANTANDTANANKTSISGLTTRVTTLEGSDHVNKINTVKVNGTALTPDGNKAVNITIDKYTLPTASATVLGGVKVGAVDDNTISAYQGANTTLRNGKLMCDLVSDSKNGALSKTDYAAFKKTGTDLAALTTRMDNAESDINNLFAGDGNIINKVRLNGTDLVPDSEKRVDLGTLVTASQFDERISSSSRILGSVSIGSEVEYGNERVFIGTEVRVYAKTTIGTSANIGASAYIGAGVDIGAGAFIYSDVRLNGTLVVGTGVNIGDNSQIGQNSHLCDNASLGTGIRLEVSNGDLMWGTVVLNQDKNITSLQSRVTALENLLKLA